MGPRRWSVAAAAAILVAAAAVALVAQLGLGGWAEQSDLHHQLQHGIFFAVGVAAGGAAVALAWLGGRSSRR